MIRYNVVRYLINDDHCSLVFCRVSSTHNTSVVDLMIQQVLTSDKHTDQHIISGILLML